MLKSISIYTVQNNLGEIKYNLKLGDLIVSTASIPNVTSTCANIKDIQNSRTECKIIYDYSGCYDDPSNAIVVSYNFGFQAKKSFSFDINSNKTEIFINDPVNISSRSIEGNIVKSVKCEMIITSKYVNPATIEKVTINWGKNKSPIIAENLNIEITGKGKHYINFEIVQDLDKTKYNMRNQSMLSGTILYRGVSMQTYTSNFSFLKVITNW